MKQTEGTQPLTNCSPKTTLLIDSSTLAPEGPVPVRLHHKLFYQLALFLFGEAQAEGRRLSPGLRAQVLERLRGIRATYLGNLTWDTTLGYAVDAAYEATKSGKNNLYRHHAESGESSFRFRL